MFTSTRLKLNKNASECIIKGISDDGGLFICNDFQSFKLTEDLVSLDYNDLAKVILKFFLNDFSKESIDSIVDTAYSKVNFRDQQAKVKILKDVAFLELYHGPTLAFKDMALTILPHLMVEAKKIQNFKKKTLILTATSGDTGGAALSGFNNVDDVQIVVLYPTKGVSNFQETQMHYYTGKNAYAIAVEGNFDDCQNLVKKVFTSNIELNNLELSSANSINIGRLVPQIVYYFYSYFEMVKKGEIQYGEKINYVVPTGNFGNILACYIAKKMGLFIDKIVCASNENNVLTDFFNNKVYDKNREFYLTNSPAMDILISSNLERLLYLITNNNEKLVNELMMDLKNKGRYELPIEYHNELNDFYAYSINPKDTVEYIKEVYNKYDYLIDPHTAVAYGAYTKYQNILKGKTVVVSTASPFKFLETVDLVFNTNKDGLDAVEAIADKAKVDVPSILYDIYNSKFDKVVWTKENMEENLRKLIGVIDENC